MPVRKSILGTPVACTPNPAQDPANPFDDFLSPCNDPVMGNVFHLFTLTLYAGAIADVQPAGFPLVVPFPPNIDPDVQPGQSFTLCETVPTGWKIPATNDVVLTPTPLPGGFDTTPTLFAHPTLASTVCFSFTIPADTTDFLINWDNTPLSKIIVVKDTVPDGPTDFGFTTTGTGLSSFTLDDDANATLSNSIVFSNLTAGAFSVTEPGQTGFDLTLLNCVSTIPAGGAGSTAFTYTPGANGTLFGAGDTTSNITLQAGATATCTYTNTQRGSITVVKDAIPDSAFDFGYTTTGTGLSAFTLDDDADATLSNTRVFSNLVPGAFTVTEAGLPITGWDITDLVCTGGGANTSTVTATGVATIGLDPGETVTCTYTNTKRGHVIIVKNSVNGCATFPYTGTGGNGLTSPFSLNTCPDNTESINFEVKPGAFTVTEGTLPLDPTGIWNFTSLSCADSTGTDSTPNETPSTTIKVATISVSAGETVTCTYINTLVVPPQYCSPGFWKQPQHFGWYEGTGVDPWPQGANSTPPNGTQYGTIFTHAPATYNGDAYGTLIFPYMIGSGGGGLWMLGRTCAASYLDAASPDLPGYPISPAHVVELCNNAYDGGVGSAAFSTAVQELGAVAIENCPLGTKTVDDGPDSNGWGSIKP
jgi:hypothetical protein